MSATAPPSGIRARHRRRFAPASYLYLLPALILVVGIVHVGIAANIGYSALDWNGISATAVPVGLANYATMLTDPVFWTSLGNTALFAVATIGLQMVFGFLLAVLVRTRAALRGLLRTLAFVPVVLAPAVVATSFRILLTPDGGFNRMLSVLPFADIDQAWLADPRTALGTIILINVWQYTGYSFLIYDAALGQVDGSVLEASRIDGASTGQVLRHIVAPLLSGSHLVLIVLGTISALKTFDIVYLTTAGGPGNTTQVLTGYIYKQAIGQFHAGYGAALSIALCVLAMIFAVLQVRLSSREAR